MFVIHNNGSTMFSLPCRKDFKSSWYPSNFVADIVRLLEAEDIGIFFLYYFGLIVCC
jgi:hypothetical protein